MKINVEVVGDMLAELSFVEQEIHDLLHSINHKSLPSEMWQMVADRILVKNDQKQQIYWLLEDEFCQGIELNEIIDIECLQNIQRK